MIKIVQFVAVAIIGEIEDGGLTEGKWIERLIDPRVMSHRPNESNTGVELTFSPLLGSPSMIELNNYQFCYEPNVEIQDIYLQARSGLTLVTTTSPH